MRTKPAFLLAIFLPLLAASAHAQTFAIKTISFRGTRLNSHAALLAASGLREDSRIAPPEIQAAAQKLNATGLFSHIGFQVAGEDLRFDLTPAANLVPVRFENFVWWSARDLAAALQSRVPLFHGEAAPNSGLAQQLIAALTAMLAEKHVAATVESLPGLDPTMHPLLVFRIASPAVVAGQISFSGIAPDPDLDKVAKAADGQPFSQTNTPAALTSAIENVEQNKGYLDAHVASVQPGPPVADGTRIEVPVMVAVTQGLQYRVGRITLDGSSLVSQQDFDRHAALKPGDVAGREKLRESLLFLTAPYQEKGYLHASVTATPSLDRARQIADYAIHVVPGPVYRMGTVRFLNLTGEQERQVRDVWTMKSGDPYNPAYTRLFLKHNSSLHFLDGYSGSYKQYEYGDTHTVDVVVTFQKGGRLS